MFALLGADVTVFDLSETQLDRDREAAAHYRYSVRIEQRDMRDPARFGNDRFDLAWHPYASNFVPKAPSVLAEVARVVRPGGLYQFYGA